MYIDTPTGRIIPIFNCDGVQIDALYEDQFSAGSEHIELSTGIAADGVSAEGSYVNHTECFGGTFTGI